MSSERHRDLTDTGEQLALAEKAASTALAMAAEKGPKVSDSSTQMWNIAKAALEQDKPRHMRECENDPAGPVCKVTRRLDDLEQRMDEMDLTIGGVEKTLGHAIGGVEKALGNALAADAAKRKQSRWAMVLVMAAIGLSTAAAAWMAVLKSSDAKAASVNSAIIEELRALRAELPRTRPMPPVQSWPQIEGQK
jgi:hypothetical protein